MFNCPATPVRLNFRESRIGTSPETPKWAVGKTGFGGASVAAAMPIPSSGT